MKHNFTFLLCFIFWSLTVKGQVYKDHMSGSLGFTTAMGLTASELASTLVLNSTDATPAYSSLQYMLNDNEIYQLTHNPVSVNMSSQKTLYIKAKASVGTPKLRVDLIDAGNMASTDGIDNANEVTLSTTYQTFAINYTGAFDGGFGGTSCLSGPCALDFSSIAALSFYVDAATGGYDGSVYIDYISIGSDFTDLTTSTSYKDHFTTPAGSLRTGSSAYTVSMDGISALQIMSDASVEPFSTCWYSLYDNQQMSGANNGMYANMNSNKTLYIRARASSGTPTLRADVADKNGNVVTDVSTNQVTLSTTYQTYTINYTGGTDGGYGGTACLSGPCAVDFTKIAGISFYVNPTTGGYNGTVYIDYIAFVTDITSCTPISTPAITTAENTGICSGNNITISGSVTGTAITYEWLKDGVVVNNGGVITGATTANLNISNFTSVHSGSYQLRASNACSSPLTSTAKSFTLAGAAAGIDAGIDQTHCNTVPTISLSGTVGGVYSGGNWASSGTGTFAPSQWDLNATYTPSVADKSAGSITITLNAYGGACGTGADQMLVTFNSCVSITVTPPKLTFCAGETFSVTYNAPGTINAGNIFTIELSNSSGTFASGTTNIGSLISTANSGSISGTIPLSITKGGNYRMRVNSTNPALTGNDNGSNIGIGTINQTSFNFSASDSDIIIGESVTMTMLGDGISCTNNFGPGAVNSGSSCTGSVYYTTAGAKDVTITAYDVYGCSATRTLTNHINVYSCSPAIPGDAQIITGTITGDGFTYGTHVLVQSGATFSPSTMGLIIYVATGGTVNATSNNLTIYAEPSSVVNCAPGTNPVVIHDDNTVLTNKPAYMREAICTTLALQACAPTANAGADQSVCNSVTSVTLSGSVGGSATNGTWSSSGTGTFTPNATTLGASYIPSAGDKTGSVTLTLTTSGGTCGTTTDNMLITFLAPATASAGPDQSLCDNVTSASLSGSIGGSATGATWSTSGTGTFSPNATTLNASYVPSVGDKTGSVTLTLTTSGGSCGTATDLLTLTFTPIATSNAGSDQTICNTFNSVSLSGSVGGSATGSTWTTSGTGTFSPNATTLNASYIPSVGDKTGSVTLTLTSSGGCGTATDNMSITFNNCTGVNVALPKSNYCAEEVFSVNYTASGTYNTGNVFSVELSNSSGNFAGGTTIIGTTSSTANNGSVSCTIPTGITAGSIYRIRVNTSDPAVTGTDNGSNVGIGRLNKGFINSNFSDQDIVANESITLTLNGMDVSSIVSCTYNFGTDAVHTPGANCTSSSTLYYTSHGTRNVVFTYTDQYGCVKTNNTNVNVYSCNPVIPANAEVITGNVTGVSYPAYTQIWVKNGAVLTLTGLTPYGIHVSAGGKVVSPIGSVVYLESGAIMDFGSGNNNVAVHDGGAIFMNSPGVFVEAICSDLVLQEPTVNSTMNISDNDAVISVFPNPATNGQFTVKGNNIEEITIINVLGQKERFAEQEIKTNLKGVLTVMIKTDNGHVYLEKIFVPE